jgi:hypothetical protein
MYRVSTKEACMPISYLFMVYLMVISVTQIIVSTDMAINE